MKNVTFKANEELIEKARLAALARGKTLNDAFQEWLQQFVGSAGNVQEFDSLMKRLRHVNSGGRFSRDEMNKR